MTFPFNYSVLTAVSKEDQATEDKDSLDFQLMRAREFGERMGGTFTREYRADGFSRSGWWDLTPALQACKDFGELARDAKLHLFDVVIVESYDRLGDLGMLFFNFFAAHGPPYIQIISVQQKIMIEDPAVYHPRRDDSIPSAIAESLKVNKYRTNKIFRAFEVGIPRRAKDGKYSRRLPRGYTFTGTKKDYRVTLDPAFKSKLIDVKDKYLQGWTLPALEQLSGWKRNAIKEMLRNPWYAGKTSYDRGVTKKNPGAKRGHWTPKDEPVPLYDGLHEKVWSYETYQTLTAEIKRRGEHMRNRREYPLTGLVVCALCNTHMHIDTIQKQRWKYYRCRSCGLLVRENIVMDEFVKALRVRITEFQDAPLEQPQPVDNSKAIAALKKKMERVRVAYETTDAYTPEEYANSKRRITKEIAELEDVEYQQEKQIRERGQQRDALASVRQLLPDIEGWMEETPAGEVNVQLSMVVREVTVRADKTVSVSLR
jgi:hypothetical protein